MNKRLLILLACSLMLLLSGCKHRQKQTTINKPNLKSDGLGLVERFRISSATMTLITGGETINLPVQVQYVRDSILTISVVPFGLEAAYLVVTDNKITAYNKLQKLYAESTLAELRDDNSVFSLIKSLGSVGPTQVADVLTGRVSSPFRMTRDFPPSQAILSTERMSVTIFYEKWGKTDSGVLIPKNVTIEVSGEKAMSATLTINKITLLQSGTFKTINTSKYSKVRITNLL